MHTSKRSKFAGKSRSPRGRRKVCLSTPHPRPATCAGTLEPVPLRFARFTQYAGRLLFVLMFVDMERPKVIVCNTIARSPYGLLPVLPLSIPSRRWLRKGYIICLFAGLLPCRTCCCCLISGSSVGLELMCSLHSLRERRSLSFLLTSLIPPSPSTTYLSLCVALFVYVFIIAAQPKWPWLYGKERERVCWLVCACAVRAYPSDFQGYPWPLLFMLFAYAKKFLCLATNKYYINTI